jgi:beta-glucosidase/6-phospho-beta-glucosidase/beta-galactosidase
MEQKLEFPKGFYWGAASASYQVEGGIYNTDWAYEARTSGRSACS